MKYCHSFTPRNCDISKSDGEQSGWSLDRAKAHDVGDAWRRAAETRPSAAPAAAAAAVVTGVGLGGGRAAPSLLCIVHARKSTHNQVFLDTSFDIRA